MVRGIIFGACTFDYFFTKIRYNKVDDTWMTLGATLPFIQQRMSAMFVENLC